MRTRTLLFDGRVVFAIHRISALVTGDKEFKQVEGEVSIRWL
jgi:hypothetical protein